MSLHRRAARKDTNHSEIVAAFLREGCTVQAISAPGAPDLVVGWRGRFNLLVEIKSERGKLNPLQRAWHASWRGSKPWVVWEAENVPALLRDVARELEGEGAL